MTSPTREEIQTAYDALETLTNTCIHSADQAEELQELVLRALPPKPHPTMADVEWDDSEHYLAEAENEGWGKVLMLGMDHESRGVTILVKTGNVVYLPCAKPQSLTPTGRRYTLTEVQE